METAPPSPADRPADRTALQAIGVGLILAAALRFGALGLAPFCIDQVRVLGTVEALLDDHVFPERGPDIGPGVFEWGTLGPLEYYLMAPLVAVTRPLLGTLHGGLLSFLAYGLIAIPLTYRLVSRHLGDPITAAIATLFYATAPYPWYLAREMMDHSFLAPCTVLFFLACCELLDGRGWAWAVVASAALAAALQFHITCVVFVPILLVVLAGARVPWRGWLGGVAAGALLYAPFLWAQVRDGFPDVTRMIAAAGGHGVGHASERAGLTVIRELVRASYRTTQVPFVESPAWIDAAGALLVVAMLGGLGVALARGDAADATAGDRSRRARRKRFSIAAWLLLPVAFLWLQRTEVYARHLALVFPAPYVLAAMALERLRRGRGAHAMPATASLGLAVTALVTLGVIGANQVTILGYLRAVGERDLIAGKLTLRAEQAFADVLIETGFGAGDAERMALAGGGAELDGIHFLLAHAAERALPKPPDLADPRRVLLVAPSESPDPILTALAAHGFAPRMGALVYTASVAPEYIEVRRDGRGLARDELATYERGAPGPVTVDAILDHTAGAPVLLAADTNLCLDGLAVASETMPWRSCAPGEVPPWAKRVVIELPSTLPSGPLPLRVDARNPVERLYLRLFDVTLPSASPLDPPPHELHGVEVRVLR